jgi:hypothetical protein
MVALFSQFTARREQTVSKSSLVPPTKTSEVSLIVHLSYIVWRLEKSKILPMIEVLKPTEEELYPFKEKVGKLVNYAQGHVLNTP